MPISGDPPDDAGRGDGRDPLRTLRVPDELWNAAKEAVRYRGDPSLSYILREALAQYVRATERRRQADATNRGANLDRTHGGYRPARRRPPP